MRDGSYVVIQAFMVSDLHLKGNELIVYATIHGFTQDGGHWFYGTRGYLAEWCGAKRETVDRCLKSLIAKGLIERSDIEEHGRTIVRYRATGTDRGTQKSSTPPQKTGTPYSKIEHINNLEKQTNKKEDKKVRETFDSIIEEFTDDGELTEALREFLKYRRAKGKGFTNTALKRNLSKLSRLSRDPHEMAEIVYQSIERGWSGLFPLKDDAAQGRETPDGMVRDRHGRLWTKEEYDDIMAYNVPTE